MPKTKTPRVVLDTNLIISAALIPHSPPEELFKSWLTGLFDLLTSKKQLEEILDVSKKDKLKTYSLFSNRVTEFIQNLEFAAEVVKPMPEDNLPLHCRDTKDDYILAMSLGGKADYLVTGDEDLLILNNNPSLGILKIVTVRQLLAKIYP